jgi:hypothetical protein
MDPQGLVKEEIIKMLDQDFTQFEKLVKEITKTKNLDKQKLGEAYFHLQKMKLELERLVWFTT